MANEANLGGYRRRGATTKKGAFPIKHIAADDELTGRVAIRA